MAATHTARTLHHRGSGDGPPTPGAGNVRTQRATCGTRLGAISTSTTTVPVTAPGSPVRVQATHAAANPEQHVVGQRETGRRPGQRQSPQCRRQHDQRAGGERRQQRHGTDPGAPAGPGRRHVDDQAGSSSRVNAAAAASSAKQTGNSTVAAAGNAAPQPPATTAAPLTPATAGQAPARSTALTITR